VIKDGEGWRLFNKILVANRGEIAIRVMKTCKELGIRTVAVYSEIDKDSLHVKMADEAYCIGPPPPIESYLNIEKIIDVAEKSKAEAIHPGYGFLAENPNFVEACEAHGIEFIGPPSRCMGKAKPKHRARKIMRAAEILVTPGSEDAIKDVDEAIEVSESIGYPVIVKPSGGGGGMGMRVVKDKNELLEAIEYAQFVGKSVFGIQDFYVEKFVPNARHIEFQVLADKKGNVVHLGERECSIQRRYQKILEEAPSPAITFGLRKFMGEASKRVAAELKYVSALTVEFLFLFDPSIEYPIFYFNEVNTRLQVEHPLTELITGIDLVKEQIRIAAGEELGYGQDDIKLRGWAIECRINAEDPYNFLPSPGKITNYQPPGGAGVRVDSGVRAGSYVSYYYDSLIAKLLTWGRNRGEAIARMKRALEDYIVEGIATTIPLHKKILENESFKKGEIDIDFIQRESDNLLPPRLTVSDMSEEEIAAVKAAITAYMMTAQDKSQKFRVKILPPAKWSFAGRQELMDSRWEFQRRIRRKSTRL
jgi:acetyl-CoA carboxylase biotin carboxylase subunit